MRTCIILTCFHSVVSSETSKALWMLSSLLYTQADARISKVNTALPEKHWEECRQGQGEPGHRERYFSKQAWGLHYAVYSACNHHNYCFQAKSFIFIIGLSAQADLEPGMWWRMTLNYWFVSQVFRAHSCISILGFLLQQWTIAH